MRNAKYHMFTYPTCFGMILFAIMTAIPQKGHTASPSPCTVGSVTPGQRTGLSHRLQILEDRNAIEELKAAYLYAADATIRDPSQVDSLLALFDDDICLDYGPFGTFRGKTDVRNYFQVIAPTIATWTFSVASHPILVINGARGTGLWKIIVGAVYTSDYDAGVQQTYGTYQDEYVKSATGWKFKVIKFLPDTPPTNP